MAKRTVCIKNPVKMRTSQSSLVVEGEQGVTVIPLEDIWVLIIETQQASFTSAMMSAVTEAGIGIIICDDKHMPVGLHLPLAAHSRHAAIVEDQLLISKPLKKQLWRRIIQAKIINQSMCLEYLGREGSEKVKMYSSEVASGDTTGREAAAASEYFRHYITEGSRRDGPYVAPLDYGYSVVRAGIARETVAGGWLVSRGLHHDNDLNPFNLVDDLLEPFRPVVDLLVEERMLTSEFDSATRSQLAQIFEYAIEMDGKRYSVQSAISKEIETFRNAVIEKNAELLKLPFLLPLEKLEDKR